MTNLENNTTGTMQAIGEFIDRQVGEKYGFTVLVFPFHDANGVINYISNAQRASIIHILRTQADILEKGLDVVVESEDTAN